MPGLEIPSAGPGALQPADLFSPPRRGVLLEIGFGGGEHLIGQALRSPDTGFLGVEPFLDGVAKLLDAIDHSGVDNIRLRRGDARDLIGELAPASLSGVYILFPDPWPKSRHHKRRLVQPVFLASLARVLRPGARVRFATDWADYAACALLAFRADRRFRWTAKRADDWRLPPADHVPTRYQQKRLGDCDPVFLDFHYLPDVEGRPA